MFSPIECIPCLAVVPGRAQTFTYNRQTAPGIEVDTAVRQALRV